MDFENDLDGLDLSVLNKSDNKVSSTPGLDTSNYGNEIESIEFLQDKPDADELEEKQKAQAEKASAKKNADIEDDEEEESDENRQDDEEDEEEPAKKGPGRPKADKASPLKIFAEMQRDKGIIDFDDEEFEDSEDFILNKVDEKINKGIQEGIDEYKSSFTQEAKDVLEALEAGIPLEALVDKNSNISTYESLTDKDIDENEALQRSLIRNLYTIKGYSKEVIDKKIQRFEDSGLMPEEAKDAKVELLDLSRQEKEQMKVQRLREKEDQSKKFENWKVSIKDTLTKNDEIIPGIKLSQAQKDKVYNGLTKFDREGRNELRKVMEKDPNFDLKVATLALALNWDFSIFDKKASTKAVKGLRDAIRGSDKFNGGYSNGVDNVKSNVNVDVIKRSMKSSGL